MKSTKGKAKSKRNSSNGEKESSFPSGTTQALFSADTLGTIQTAGSIPMRKERLLERTNTRRSIAKNASKVHAMKTRDCSRKLDVVPSKKSRKTSANRKEKEITEGLSRRNVAQKRLQNVSEVPTGEKKNIENVCDLAISRAKAARHSIPTDSDAQEIQSDLFSLEGKENISPNNLNGRQETAYSKQKSETLDDTNSSLCNKLKAKISELKRDKNAFADAVIDMKRRNETLQEQLQETDSMISHLKMEMKTLERNSKRPKKPPKKAADIPGDAIHVHSIVKQRAVVESKLRIYEISGDILENFKIEKTTVRRNWGRCLLFQEGEKDMNSEIVHPSMDGVYPKFPMELAHKGALHASAHETNDQWVKSVACHVIYSALGVSVPDSRKERAIQVISQCPQILEKYKISLSGAMSALKKKCLSIFLKGLGYKLVAEGMSASKTTNVYKQELLILLDRVVRKRHDGELDLSHLRLSGSSEICRDEHSAALDEEGYQAWPHASWVPEQKRTDILFANQAARDAYVEWAFYDKSLMEDASSSITKLARMDAWISTFLLKLEDGLEAGGKSLLGGVRNLTFNAVTASLLPRATEEILRFARLRLSESGASTDVIRFSYPRTSYRYMAVTSCFFKNEICAWMGEIPDCYTGRLSQGENIYMPLISDQAQREENIPDDSDVEDDVRLEQLEVAKHTLSIGHCGSDNENVEYDAS